MIDWLSPAIHQGQVTKAKIKYRRNIYIQNLDLSQFYIYLFLHQENKKQFKFKFECHIFQFQKVPSIFFFNHSNWYEKLALITS